MHLGSDNTYHGGALARWEIALRSVIRVVLVASAAGVLFCSGQRAEQPCRGKVCTVQWQGHHHCRTPNVQWTRQPHWFVPSRIYDYGQVFPSFGLILAGQLALPCPPTSERAMVEARIYYIRVSSTDSLRQKVPTRCTHSHHLMPVWPVVTPRPGQAVPRNATTRSVPRLLPKVQYYTLLVTSALPVLPYLYFSTSYTAWPHRCLWMDHPCTKGHPPGVRGRRHGAGVQIAVCRRVKGVKGQSCRSAQASSWSGRILAAPRCHRHGRGHQNSGRMALGPPKVSAAALAWHARPLRARATLEIAREAWERAADLATKSCS